MAVGVNTGVCKEEVVASDPVQDQIVALLELDCSVTEPPLQSGLVFVAPLEDGTGLTLTVVV